MDTTHCPYVAHRVTRAKLLIDSVRCISVQRAINRTNEIAIPQTYRNASGMNDALTSAHPTFVGSRISTSDICRIASQHIRHLSDVLRAAMLGSMPSAHRLDNSVKPLERASH